MSLVDYFFAGGPLMYPLLASAIIGLAFSFERWIVLGKIPTARKAEVELDAVEKALDEGGLEGAAKHVAKGKGILNYVFARLLKRYDTLMIEKKEFDRVVHKDRQQSKETGDAMVDFLNRQSELSTFKDELQLTGDDAVKKYVTRFILVINNVSTVAPLLGLLGTITGMILSFNSIAESGTGDPKVVAAGVAQALITTAAGLFIAIPATILYAYFASRAENARSSIELYAMSFANTLLAEFEKELSK